MVEVIFHLVVFWQTQQVTVLHVHQIVRLQIPKETVDRGKHTNQLTVAFLMFISPHVFILINDHHTQEAWLFQVTSQQPAHCATPRLHEMKRVTIGSAEKVSQDKQSAPNERGTAYPNEPLPGCDFVAYIHCSHFGCSYPQQRCNGKIHWGSTSYSAR